MLIGGVLPALVLMVCLLLLIQDRLLAYQQQKLKPDADRFDSVQKRLTNVVAEIDAIKSRNRAIAVAMADVRSSSALLGEMTLLIPADMALDRFQVEGSRLLITGTVLQPNGLRTINSFLLRLTKSSLFDSQLIQLEKAEVKATSGGVTSLMRFSLNAVFSDDAARATRPRLDLLGASGLAARVYFLESEQLLP